MPLALPHKMNTLTDAMLQQTFKDYGSDLEHGNVRLEIHDYFTPQETVADVYWLRGVV